jgi:hypothetical protein
MLLEESDKRLDNILTKEVEPQVAFRDPDQRLQTNNNMMKPQNQWINQIENSYSSFVPLVKNKLHAKVPLDPKITQL